MYSAFIPVPKEFSFKECITFLNRSDNECLHSITSNKVIKLLRISGKLLLIEISSAPDLLDYICLKFLNSDPTLKEIQLTKTFVSEWFDLSNDLKPFYRFAEKDIILKEIVKKYFGLRLIGIPDFFEAITWAIIGQQINLTFAFKLKRNFVEKYGESFMFENNKYYLYPAAEKISKIKKSELLNLQFSKQKAEYVIETANTLINNKISKERLSDLSFTEAKGKLCEMHGVGNWTANYVLMKCLRNPYAFPIEDVGLHNAVKNILNLEAKPAIEEIKKLSAKWNGWYSYSVFYLWRSLLSDEK